MRTRALLFVEPARIMCVLWMKGTVERRGKRTRRTRIRAYTHTPGEREMVGFLIEVFFFCILLLVADSPFLASCPNSFLVGMWSSRRKELHNAPSPLFSECPPFVGPPQPCVSSVSCGSMLLCASCFDRGDFGRLWVSKLNSID